MELAQTLNRPMLVRIERTSAGNPPLRSRTGGCDPISHVDVGAVRGTSSGSTRMQPGPCTTLHNRARVVQHLDVCWYKSLNVEAFVDRCCISRAGGQRPMLVVPDARVVARPRHGEPAETSTSDAQARSPEKLLDGPSARM